MKQLMMFSDVIDRLKAMDAISHMLFDEDDEFEEFISHVETTSCDLVESRRKVMCDFPMRLHMIAIRKYPHVVNPTFIK